MTHATGSKRPVPSLLTISIDYVGKNLWFYRESLHYLTPRVKDRILRKLTKSNKHSDVQFDGILEALVHLDLKYIDLSSVPVSDTTLNHLTSCFMLREINLKHSEAHNFTSGGLKLLLKHTERLLALDVSNCPQFDDEVMEILSVNCPQLCELNCDHCSVSDRGLSSLALHNKNVKSLSIRNTKITGDGIMDAVSDRNWRNIKELRLDKCAKVDEDVIRIIVGNSPIIEVLTFYNCDLSEETSIFYDITNRCKKLKQLNWTINWKD